MSLPLPADRLELEKLADDASGALAALAPVPICVTSIVVGGKFADPPAPSGPGMRSFSDYSAACEAWQFDGHAACTLIAPTAPPKVAELARWGVPKLESVGDVGADRRFRKLVAPTWLIEMVLVSGDPRFRFKDLVLVLKRDLAASQVAIEQLISRIRIKIQEPPAPTNQTHSDGASTASPGAPASSPKAGKRVRIGVEKANPLVRGFIINYQRANGGAIPTLRMIEEGLGISDSTISRTEAWKTMGTNGPRREIPMPSVGEHQQRHGIRRNLPGPEKVKEDERDDD